LKWIDGAHRRPRAALDVALPVVQAQDVAAASVSVKAGELHVPALPPVV
jgi:hypothetical protein